MTDMFRCYLERETKDGAVERVISLAVAKPATFFSIRVGGLSGRVMVVISGMACS